MSAATSSRSSATWSRLRSRRRGNASARTCRPEPSLPPRNACSMPWSAPTPAPQREIRSAGNCAPASSTTRKSRSRRSPPAACRCSRFPACPAPRWGRSRSATSSARWAAGPRPDASRSRVRTSFWSTRSPTSCWTTISWCRNRSARSRTTASCSSTRSTRSASATAGSAATSRARACSATCCR
jgi:hypothetical protein